MDTDISNTDYFNGIARALADAQRQLDFDDSQRELAGVEVGRIGRFLSPEAREALREGKGAGSRAVSSLSALDWMLLNDPDYAQAYEGAMNALADAEDTVEEALEKALGRVDVAQNAVDRTLDEAMRLPDGRAVFMDADNAVRTEDGKAVDPALAATLEWQGNEPSYETFVERRDRLDTANDAVTAIRGDQIELGEIREELTDRDDPASREHVDELQGRIDLIGSRYAPRDEPEPTAPSQSFEAAKPDMTGL